MYAAIFALVICIFNFYVADFCYRDGNRLLGIANGIFGILNLMCVAKYLFSL